MSFSFSLEYFLLFGHRWPSQSSFAWFLDSWSLTLVIKPTTDKIWIDIVLTGFNIFIFCHFRDRITAIIFGGTLHSPKQYSQFFLYHVFLLLVTFLYFSALLIYANLPTVTLILFSLHVSLFVVIPARVSPSVSLPCSLCLSLYHLSLHTSFSEVREAAEKVDMDTRESVGQVWINTWWGSFNACLFILYLCIILSEWSRAYNRKRYIQKWADCHLIPLKSVN